MIEHVVGALRRSWYVLVAGLVLTALVILQVRQVPPVYYSRVEVLLLAPASEAYPNSLRTTSGPLIMTAGVVETLINGTEQRHKFASMEATIVGAGVRDGVAVMLPDNGGQWAPNFNEQAIDVQVAGTSEPLVRKRRAAVVAEIARTLDKLQDDAGVDPVNRIISRPAAMSATISQMGGERKRAMVMAGVVGGGASLLAAMSLDAVRGRRASERDRPGHHLAPGGRRRRHRAGPGVVLD